MPGDDKQSGLVQGTWDMLIIPGKMLGLQLM